MNREQFADWLHRQGLSLQLFEAALEQYRTVERKPRMRLLGVEYQVEDDLSRARVITDATVQEFSCPVEAWTIFIQTVDMEGRRRIQGREQQLGKEET